MSSTAQRHRATVFPPIIRLVAAVRGPEVTPSAPDAHGAPGRIRLFGGILATDRSLPGLPVAAHAGDGQFVLWHLETHDGPASGVGHTADARLLGRLEYSSGPVVTLGETGNSTEVLVSDTGRFTLSEDGAHIAHLAPPHVDRSAVALDLIGVVLPVALHRDGAWCVHASAVRTPSGVVAFIAERGTGKSTLAATCVQEGSTLVADDVVVLRESPAGISVTPSGAPLRLRAATARAVGAATDDVDSWGKVRVAGEMAHDTLPLAAIYVLQATSPDGDVQRVPRAPRAAALALLAHGKITALLGGDAAGVALSRCVSLAHRAAVYDLAVPRNLARIGEVTAQLLDWHAAPAPHRAMS
jgi:hypothetical protein